MKLIERQKGGNRVYSHEIEELVAFTQRAKPRKNVHYWLDLHIEAAAVPGQYMGANVNCYINCGKKWLSLSFKLSRIDVIIINKQILILITKFNNEVLYKTSISSWLHKIGLI